LQRRCERRRL
ncbi:vgrG protein, partial [Vibrio cholerae HC-68A1]